MGALLNFFHTAPLCGLRRECLREVPCNFQGTGDGAADDDRFKAVPEQATHGGNISYAVFCLKKSGIQATAELRQKPPTGN